jgi:hypothetical protein
VKRRDRLKLCGAGLALLFVLTAGFGLFVPPIEGLGGCEYQCKELLLAILIGVTVVPVLAMGCLACGKRRAARLLLLLWPLAVTLNIALGQDPVCAAVNWEVGSTDSRETEAYREWQIVTCIENHEQVCYDAERRVFYVGRGA